MCDGCIHYDACKALVVGLDGHDIDTVFFKGKCPNRRVAITPEEFAKKMMDIRKKYIDDREWPDREYAHEDMDFAMEKLLESLGYGEGVDIFDKTYKWYA